MKYVLRSGSEIGHLWAHQTQDSARAGNVSFNGTAFVSYNTTVARKGLLLVKAVLARGEAWQRNGHTCHLGHYQIDRIEANGTVHAGCHVVSYEAIDRISAALLAMPESTDERGAA